MRRFIVILCLLTIMVSFSSLAQDTLATSVTVIGEDLYFSRTNTDTEFTLSEGAVSPFGIGDTIRTGDNGRAIIQVSNNAEILLLPNTVYTVINYAPENGRNLFIGQIEGIAIHRLADANLDYQLIATGFDLEMVTDEADFGVWAVQDRPSLQAITSLRGELAINVDDVTLSVTDGTGRLPALIEELVTLDGLLHPTQIADTVALCDGVVNTNGGAGLRLRAGAALDYPIVGILQDGQAVQIIGTTENGLWYRIPDLTSYGWMFSNLIDADCDALPTFENLVGEVPERIDDVTERELDLLAPYYGLPSENITFYR